MAGDMATENKSTVYGNFQHWNPLNLSRHITLSRHTETGGGRRRRRQIHAAAHEPVTAGFAPRGRWRRRLATARHRRRPPGGSGGGGGTKSRHAGLHQRPAQRGARLLPFTV